MDFGWHEATMFPWFSGSTILLNAKSDISDVSEKKSTFSLAIAIWRKLVIKVTLIWQYDYDCVTALLCVFIQTTE